MPDAREEALTSSVRALHRVFQEVDTASRRLLKDFGVSGPQLWALRTIQAARGLTIGELADLMYLHISTVSGILDRLEKNGWVERRRAHEDRRVTRLTLTRKGRAIIARAPEPPRSRVLRGLRDLDDRALAEMSRSMERLMRILEREGPAS
jgi:DNA-binding MarR family transcriptional regulator